MSTTNRITVTRNAIIRSTKEVQSRLRFETETLEVEIKPGAMLYVSVDNREHLDYNEIEITDVEVLTGKDRLYPNIIAFIGSELDRTANFMNKEERDNAEAWDYQREYETITGKFAY